MLVRMITTYARPGLTAGPDSVIEVSAEEGKSLIEGNYASPFDAEAPVVRGRGRRTAVVRPSETADL